MKVYNKYKDSNDVWLGKVPEHWIVSSLKHFVDIVSGYAFKSEDYSDDKGIPIIRIGDISNTVDVINAKRANPKNLDELDRFIIKKGDLLLAMTGATIGKSCMFNSDEIAYVNQRVGLLRGKGLLSQDYLKYFIDTPLFREFISLTCSGSAQENISTFQISELKFLLPSSEEQTKITQYLDHQTNIIDELINKKQALIELLKEKRQAIINETATKGLNPNAKMKDSGIKWLGEIPYDWNLRNFETVANTDRYSITGGPFGSDLKNEEYTEEGVRIIQLQNIGVGEFKDAYKIFTSEEKADQLFSCNIYPGDIIIAKMADPVARACVVPDMDKRYIMASDGIRLEVDKSRHNTKFIEYAINSKYFNYQAELNSTGSTRLRIGLNALKKLKFILPSLEEQNLITNYLVSFDEKYFETINKLEKQILGLNEYRQAIISEAVTGKIDVRDWKS